VIIYFIIFTLFGLPFYPPLTLFPHSQASRENPFHPLVLQFCWRENIRDNKKDIAFLLVWDNDSYTERFLALFPCTSVLQPTLVHLYQTSSLLPSPLPIVASASLKLLYSLIYSGHINTSFRFSSFSLFLPCVCSPLSVWPVSHNITAVV
jgi:hypothetical protein